MPPAAPGTPARGSRGRRRTRRSSDLAARERRTLVGRGGRLTVRLRLATRRSPLALAQTRGVAAALRAAGHEVELLELVTTGDRWSGDLTHPPSFGGGPATPPPDRGLFVKELEEALLEGRAELAVHSAKDLPADLPDGLGVLAVPARADPRDVLVGTRAGLGALARGARVATGSPRRAAQLLAARDDLAVVPIRGNVDTRLRKLASGEADALVLAAAGLARLGLAPPATALAPEVCTPAPGQGFLAVEGRLDRADVAAAAGALADAVAGACLRAERALLAGMGGGCMTPVGALCSPGAPGELRLVAFAGNPDGTGARRAVRTGALADPEGLGRAAAAALGGVPA